MTAVSYTLLVDGSPIAPEALTNLQQVEVEEHVDLADMLRLTFAIGVKEDGSGWNILDDGIFTRLANVRLEVTVGSSELQPLIDAYVVETNVEFSNEPGETVLNVLAMDGTALMNLEEKIRPWLDMADSDIASAIFDEYGFDPVVESTQPTREEAVTSVLQRDTDIRFLRVLARRNGFECYVDVDAASGRVRGHFHPAQLDKAPQGVLSVNMGQATNVTSFSVRYDMLRPTTASGLALDLDSQEVQTGEADGLSQTELGSQATLNGDQPRHVLLSQTGLVQSGELQTYAQAVVDSTALAVRAEGELDTLIYGAVLRAKLPVLVRGIGREFSGTYYAERVLHTIAGDEYTQAFTLRRNATGLTGQEDFSPSSTLA